jgi:hypothetical protein
MTSPKEFRDLERKRFIEYCESSQRAMTVSVALVQLAGWETDLGIWLVAVPYWAEMACIMSSAVSPFFPFAGEVRGRT